MPGATDYFYVASEGGNYNVVATDANGCEVEAVIFDVVADVQLAIGSGQFAIFPNPVDDKFTILNLDARLTKAHRGVKSTIEVSLYNLFGELAVCLPIANCALPIEFDA